MRFHWLAVIAVAFIGCESLRSPSPPAALPPSPLIAARQPSIVPVAASSPPAPAIQVQQDDPLTLAAECLERGDRPNAAVHLEAYLRTHPEQIMFRLQLAEMLLRVGRDDAAKIHFEQFVTDAQRTTGAPKNQLVHVHTRLMEIGQRTDDSFAESFHRGVGLLLLVKEQDGKRDRETDFCEEMLCKSMKALTEAKELAPGDPQVRMYLAEVYERAGNRHAADAERAAARAAVVPAGLAPTFCCLEWVGTR